MSEYVCVTFPPAALFACFSHQDGIFPHRRLSIPPPYETVEICFCSPLKCVLVCFCSTVTKLIVGTVLKCHEKIKCGLGVVYAFG